MYSIGPSSYPDLRGIDQVIATDRMAQQYWSVKVDFDAWMAKKGRTGRLSPNEGYRSKDRCMYLWDNRFALGIVVAPPLTSRHYKNPNAIDFGVTEPMGMNRALSPDEFTKLHELVENRGGTWTGVNFGEQWHHEMATRPEVLPPYPNARALAEAGPTPIPKPDTPAAQQEEEMVVIVGVPNRGIWVLDFGQNTRYNIAAGGLTSDQGYAKRDFMVATGVRFVDKQAPRVLDGFKDITDTFTAVK
jgi:hypothetical protein